MILFSEPLYWHLHHWNVCISILIFTLGSFVNRIRLLISQDWFRLGIEKATNLNQWWPSIIRPQWINENLWAFWYGVTRPQWVNTLKPRQNGRHFPDDIFKWIFLNENIWILIKISLKFVPRGSINNIPALVRIMAWRRPGDKPLSEPMVVSLLTQICVTRPQWVNENVTYKDLLWNLLIMTSMFWGGLVQKQHNFNADTAMVIFIVFPVIPWIACWEREAFGLRNNIDFKIGQS